MTGQRFHASKTHLECNGPPWPVYDRPRAMAQTIRFTRRHFPHWEVEQGRYFITVRCADSLPREAGLRLIELAGAQHLIDPRTAQFAAHQRIVFRILEKYLDSGFGSCPLHEPRVARILCEELTALHDWQVSCPSLHGDAQPLARTARALSRLLAFTFRHYEAPEGAHRQTPPGPDRRERTHLAARMI